jgi:hypothetical protein
MLEMSHQSLRFYPPIQLRFNPGMHDGGIQVYSLKKKSLSEIAFLNEKLFIPQK